MRSAFSTYSRILQLDTDTFVTIKHLDDRVWFALRFFVIMALIGALGKWALLGSLMNQPTLPEIAHQIADIGYLIAGYLPEWLGFLATFLKDVSDLVLEIETKLAALAPPIGTRPSRVVLLIGQWLSTPFNLMAYWFGYALVLAGVARWFGGRGSLTQHLSLVALAIAPYILSIVSNFEPTSIIASVGIGIAGRALVVIGLAWSAAILVRAVAVAHEFTIGRSIAVLLIAFILLYVLLPLALSLTAAFVFFG